MFSVSARMSTNTGTAPRSTKALAVETNVNDGMMTSSPGSRSSSSAAISSAAVHECVSSALARAGRRSSHAWQRFVKAPIAGEMPVRVRLGDVVELAAGHVRLVERNSVSTHRRFRYRGGRGGGSVHKRLRRARRATTSSDPPAGRLTPSRIRARSRPSVAAPIEFASGGKSKARLRLRPCRPFAPAREEHRGQQEASRTTSRAGPRSPPRRASRQDRPSR